MSNIGNIFGNEGYIQSSIDRSRGKSRPGKRARRKAKGNAKRRRKLLNEDPLFQKHGSGPLVSDKKQKKRDKKLRKKNKLSLKDLIKRAATQKRGILDPNARPVG